MTPDLLREVGTALYGPIHWQVGLEAALDVDRRTLGRWLSGKTPIPDGVKADLRKTVEARAAHLTQLLEKL